MAERIKCECCGVPSAKERLNTVCDDCTERTLKVYETEARVAGINAAAHWLLEEASTVFANGKDDALATKLRDLANRMASEVLMPASQARDEALKDRDEHAARR